MGAERRAAIARLGRRPRRAWQELGGTGRPGRVSRLDRGWSTVLVAIVGHRARVRNIGADVAVGDWVVPSGDDERVEHVLPRRSAFVRRASFEGSRAVAHTLAANIDVVFLTHSFGADAEPAPPRARARAGVRQRRRAGGRADQGRPRRRSRAGPPRARRGRPRRARARGQRAQRAPASTSCGRSPRAAGRCAFLGASGVGKSTLDQRPARRGTPSGHRGPRRATSAAATPPSPPSCCALPGEGWLIDTPGVRAVSLWLSGEGIERAFADVFELMDHCRFRDCKHDQEPGCAVRAAIEEGRSTRSASPASSASSPRRRRSRRSSGSKSASPTAAGAAGRRRNRMT